MKDLSSKRIEQIKPSITVSLSQKAKEYSAQGRDVINVTTGELPFEAPNHIRQSLIKSLEEGKDKYSNPSGINELKEAVVDKFREENDLNFTEDEIIIGNGVKELFFNLMASTISKDDEVLIPAPYWVSFPEIVSFFDGNPVTLKTSQKNNFKINPEELSSSITKKTKWLIINSPSNPTGSVYSSKELEDIADVLRETQNQHISIISDDIYEKVLFDDNKFENILNIAPDLIGRVVVLNGFSKSFCMTGWRLGYAAAKKEIIDQISKIKSHSNTCTPPFIQFAGVSALKEDYSFFSENLIKIKNDRDLILDGLNSIDGISCLKPDGAFYVFPSCKNFLGCVSQSGKVINSSIDFASYLLEDYNLAVVPGEAFGLNGYFRISFTIGEDLIKELIDRLSKACSKLKKT
ncbi:pyridoxal phosphate-dependent aminotransferase [Gammaproteobacteria bacterium]|nr:pyridoxal phosphate-dependent aminotransferase [Gammaproteobacteria bacterium]